LVESGSATATELSDRLKLPRTGLYRILNKLVKQGFVVGPAFNFRPKLYHARPLDQALEYFAKYQKQQVKTLYWFLANKRTVGKRQGPNSSYMYRYQNWNNKGN